MRVNFQIIAVCVILLLLFLNVTPLLYAQGSGKINIAVMDLEALGVPADAQKALSDRLRNELFNTGRFSVMERNRMNEVLKEQGFQQTGCTSNECIVEVGRLLGVDRMIGGSIGKVGTIYTVSLRMIDIETGRIMISKTEDCNCPIEQVLTSSLRNVALKMAGLSPDSDVLPVLREETVIGQGDFYFKSTPSEAQVFIDDQPLPGVTPLTKEAVSAGTHQVRMQKGFYSASQTMFLEPNEFKRVELTLLIAKGSLKIVTTPLEADIFLDNKSLGTSPQTLTNLDAGEHWLKLSRSGYLDHEQVVFIDGSETKRMDIALEKIKAASLKIISIPPECEAYINDQYKGKTPLAIGEFMPGGVQLKLLHPLYEPWQETIVLKNGEIKEITSELSKKKGTLIIESNPAQAAVELDGVLKGQTPLTLTDVEYGSHTVRFYHKDTQATDQKVELYAAGPQKVYVPLQLAPGMLSITGSPAGAAIFFDDKKKGALPLEKYQLIRGNYKITVKARGYESYSQTVSVQPNEETTVSVDLLLKSKTKALTRSLILPGLGQAYLGNKGKAVLFPLLEISAVAGAVIYHNTYNGAVGDYDVAKEKYNNAFSQTNLNTYYTEMMAAYDDIETADKMRTICIGAAAAVWLWNVADVVLFGPQTDTNVRLGHEKDSPFELTSTYVDGNKLIGFNYKF